MDVASLFDLVAPDDKPSVAPVILRPYQEKAKQAVLASKDRGVERVLIVMPTGTGKTSLFSDLIGTVDQESLVVAHRVELLQQARDRIALQNPNLRVSIESGEQSAAFGTKCVVAGVQSIGRSGSSRLPWFKPKFMIVDEAHHACADSYQHVMNRFGSYLGQCFTLGVTATPHRLDNRPLHGDDKSIFQEVAFTYTLRDAIADHWLCDLRAFTVGSSVDLSKVKTTAGDFNQGQLADVMNTDRQRRLAFDSWQKIASGRRTIVFCVTVDHAKDVAEYFAERGVKAAYVSGEMDRDQRAKNLELFRRGEIQVLTNVEIATEGFDLPEISCVLLLRPTQSWALYTQMVGRGLRLADNKPDCIIIDVVGNSGLQASAGTPKPRQKAVSVAGLVGLPEDLDLDGHTLLEAVEAFDELSPAQKAALFKRPCRFEHLSAELQEVDILADLAPAEEVARSSKLSWLKLADGIYYLNCGTHDGTRIDAKLQANTLGDFDLQISVDRELTHIVPVGSDIPEAFRLADRDLRDRYPFIDHIANRNAPWKAKPPTDKQLFWLRKKGVAEDVIQRMDAGQAGQMLTKLFAGKK